jgi:hypothetical protein
VNPEIPVYRDPQKALTDADECGRLRDRVGREIVELHAVVEAKSPHEAARRRHEAPLVEADEANHIAARGLGAWSLAGGTIHFAGRPSSFSASWPAVTNWPRASRVADERSHGNGSTMMRGCWGAIRAGEEARRKEQEELREEKDAMARTARRLEREEQGWQMLR